MRGPLRRRRRRSVAGLFKSWVYQNHKRASQSSQMRFFPFGSLLGLPQLYYQYR